jgi:hypothetical protein
MKFSLLTLTFVALINLANSQTQNDTIKAYISKTPVVIDGRADDACWQTADWHAMDQVMIPWNAYVSPDDFTGRFKVSWDASYLYILVEVTDDSISDDHADPLTNWWDDDCCEVFIDEDRSKGGHECTNNAFAYHVSIFYDAIDMSPTCAGINYKNHVNVKMDTVGEHQYIWELAFKIYNSTYNNSNPEASRVVLSNDKLMGFAIAYCDNDETTARENFIGSQKLTSTTANDMYKNASLFGPMRLIDPDAVNVNDRQGRLTDFNIIPINNYQQLQVIVSNQPKTNQTIIISSITGQVLSKINTLQKDSVIDISGLAPGLYIVSVTNGNTSSAKKFIKQ